MLTVLLEYIDLFLTYNLTGKDFSILEINASIMLDAFSSVKNYVTA